MSLEDKSDADADAEAVLGLRAVAHPVRLRILSLLTGADMSAAEVARELDMTQANASYHVRVLAKSGHLEEAGVENVRGGQAKKYRYVSNRAAVKHRGRKLSPEQSATEHALMLEALSTEMRRRVQYREPQGDGTFTDAELWLDPDDWARALELVREASVLVHERAKRPRADGTIHVSFVADMYGMTDHRNSGGDAS